ncbi:unnamed protein product, partial [Amoebophrya sp. A25]|eukprot:GSA25T00027864001.1
MDSFDQEDEPPLYYAPVDEDGAPQYDYDNPDSFTRLQQEKILHELKQQQWGHFLRQSHLELLRLQRRAYLEKKERGDFDNLCNELRSQLDLDLTAASNGDLPPA